jgi:hypothetical protein
MLNRSLKERTLEAVLFSLLFLATSLPLGHDTTMTVKMENLKEEQKKKYALEVQRALYHTEAISESDMWLCHYLLALYSSGPIYHR